VFTKLSAEGLIGTIDAADPRYGTGRLEDLSTAHWTVTDDGLPPSVTPPRISHQRSS
jgi:hypothetical protein